MTRDYEPPSSVRRQWSMDLVGAEWEAMSLEEWVARKIHRYPMLSATNYSYSNQRFVVWIRGLEPLPSDDGRWDELRRKYLTDEGIAKIEAYAWEEL